MDEVIQQSSIPQQAPIQPETPPENSNSNWLRTLAIGFGIVSIGTAIAVGGYFLGTKNSQSPVQKIVTQPSPTPVDETANWKTYTNTKFGISIKYPDILPPDEFSPNQAGEKDYTVVHFVEKQIEPGIASSLGIWINLYGKDPSAYYLVQQKNDYESLLSLDIGTKKQIGGSVFTRLPSEKILNEAYIFEERAVPNYPAEIVPYAKTYIIKRDNTLIQISVVPVTENPNDQYLTYFSQILSTFRFAN